MKRITQSLLALLLLMLGGATANALETYDFQDLCMALGKGGPWAVNDGGDAGFTLGTDEAPAVMHYLGDYTVGDQTFTWNQRFAYEYVDGRGKFTMRNKSNKRDGNCGMFSWDYAHYFSVLDLKAGDKVTITCLAGTTTLVSSNVEGIDAGTEFGKVATTYTIASGDRLDIQMQKATLISKIVIEPYGVETVPVITVSPKTLNLIPGASAKLGATVDPAGAEVKWKSSDESVVFVDNDGVVVAQTPGTAEITCYWESGISDAKASDVCVVTVADIDMAQLSLAKSYDFTALGDVTLTLQADAAGKIWNAANNTNNNVFFCTNDGLELLAVQAAAPADGKGWSIVDGDGLVLGTGAGRCAAIGGIKAGQIVEFVYTGDAFYTKNDGTSDDGIEKTALNEQQGRAMYKAAADGMIGFELVKGSAVRQIYVYEENGPKPYQFVASEWPAGDPGRISASNVVVDAVANTITVDAQGDNNVALNFKTDKTYYITKPVKYFVVRGTGLSVEDGKAYLWWCNAKNNGAQEVPAVVRNDEGVITLAWDITQNTAFASGFNPEGMSYLDGTGASTWGWTTTFGLTLANPAVPAVISYIGYEADGSDVVTAIESVKAAQQHTGTVYNMAGQRVQQAVKGLYIRDGKKFIVR